MPPVADAGLDGRLRELYASAREARRRAQRTVGRAEATLQETMAARQEHRLAWARAERLRELWVSGRRDQLRYSALARLQARLASMPVIEQAKGVLMAQCGWTENEAFDALRKASQRSNIPVRDLAGMIVASTAGARAAPGNPAGREAQKPADVVLLARARTVATHQHGRAPARNLPVRHPASPLGGPAVRSSRQGAR
jgi:hypothetical protein